MGSDDFAFNNAGIEIEQGRLADGTQDEFDAIMGVNVKGVWLCMKYQLPLMLAQGGGAIVNTAAGAGLGAGWGQRRALMGALYCRGGAHGAGRAA